MAGCCRLSPDSDLPKTVTNPIFFHFYEILYNMPVAACRKDVYGKKNQGQCHERYKYKNTLIIQLKGSYLEKFGFIIDTPLNISLSELDHHYTR